MRIGVVASSAVQNSLLWLMSNIFPKCQLNAPLVELCAHKFGTMENMPSYTELQREIARLMQQAEAARKAEVSAVIAEIKAKMAEFGITVADLGSTGRSSRAKGATVAAKYRNSATGETWTGRGKMPRWLHAQVSAGKRKEDFLIG